MSMKERIRRAFELGKPNVLNRVLEDCPAPENASVKKKRKRLSDRTVEFIATAASVALLIGAVGAGIVYFRSNYTLNSGTPGGDGYEPTYGTGYTRPEPVDTSCPDFVIAPLPTVDYTTTPNGLITRTDDILYPLYLRDSLYEVPDLPVETVTEYGVEMYRIVNSMNGYCYEFKFLAANGALSSIAVLDCECEKTGPISPYAATWIAMMDLAPDCYGISRDCDYNYALNGDNTYTITLDFSAVFTYTVDALTGEILEISVAHEPVRITAVEARNFALGLWGHSIKEIRCLKIAFDSDMYEVYYELGEFAYQFVISAQDGSVLYDKGMEEIGLRADEQMAHLIGWQAAREIALEACGYGVEDLIGFTYEYVPGDPDAYWMELYFQDAGFSYRIDALSGAILERPFDDRVDFSVSSGTSHAAYGDLLSNYGQAKLTVITSPEELAALHNSADHTAPPQYDEAFFRENALLIIDYATSTSTYHIEVANVTTDPSGSFFVSVNLYMPESGDTAIAGGSLIVEIHQALKPTTAAELTLNQYTLPYEEFNALVNGTGFGSDQIGIDDATVIAMEVAGCLEDYIAGAVEELACKYDEDTDPENPRYWIYFKALDYSYEVAVHALTGEILEYTKY